MVRLIRVAHWLALLAPAALVLALVLRYGVNVPFWDQWELVGALIRLDNGDGLDWPYIVGQHNEHRMVFPKLLMLALAALTDWNIRAELLASIALCAGSLVVLMALARPVLRDAGAATRLWAALTISAMLFSLVQWENWLWGWQVQWFLAIFAAISTVALATWSLRSKTPWAHVVAAAGAAIVCQYSIASGAAIWVSGGMVFGFHPRRRHVLPVWLALAVASTALYLIGYERPGQHPSPLESIRQPINFIIYLGNYLSGPFGPYAGFGLAATGGFLALAVIASLRFRRAFDMVLPWIAIASFAGANAVLTGIGRVGFGAAQGLASRYVTTAVLLSVTLVLLGILAFRAWPPQRWPVVRAIAGASGALLLTGLVVNGSIGGLAGFSGRSSHLTAARDCVLLVEQATDDCLKLVYPNVSWARHRLLHLHALGWSGFRKSDGLPPRTLRLLGPDGPRLWTLRAEDGIVGSIGPATLESGMLRVSGWARDPRGDPDAIRRVLVVGNGKALGEAEVVLERWDVAAAVRDPSMHRSGWTFYRDGFAAGDVPLLLKAYLIYSDGVLVPLDGAIPITNAQ